MPTKKKTTKPKEMSFAVTIRDSEGPMDTPLGSQLRQIEPRIAPLKDDPSNADALQARWESGLVLVKFSDTGKLPSGHLKAIAAALGTTQKELKERVNLAKQMPKEYRYQGREVAAPTPDVHAQLRDAFNPETGAFADNIRSAGSLTELKESMKEFGWLDQLPVIKDERGVTLMGHRRLLAAAELRAEGVEIEDKIVTMKFGDGDEADAERFRLAIASNLGSRGLSPTDRKHLATYLYSEQDWTTERIGQALKVSGRQIRRDLDIVSKKEKKRQGGPGESRKSRKAKLTVVPDTGAPKTEPTVPCPKCSMKIHESALDTHLELKHKVKPKTTPTDDEWKWTKIEAGKYTSFGYTVEKDGTGWRTKDPAGKDIDWPDSKLQATEAAVFHYSEHYKPEAVEPEPEATPDKVKAKQRPVSETIAPDTVRLLEKALMNAQEVAGRCNVYEVAADTAALKKILRLYDQLEESITLGRERISKRPLDEEIERVLSTPPGEVRGG